MLKLESEVLKVILGVSRNFEVSERTTPKILEELRVIAPHNLEGPQRMILHKLKAPEGMIPHKLEAPERILSRSLEEPERIVPHTLIQWMLNRLNFISISRRSFLWYC